MNCIEFNKNVGLGKQDFQNVLHHFENSYRSLALLGSVGEIVGAKTRFEGKFDQAQGGNSPELALERAEFWREGDTCLAKWAEDGVWYRARIRHFFCSLENEKLENKRTSSALVFFVDYGNEDHVLAQNLVTTLAEIPFEDLVDETVLLGDTEEERVKIMEEEQVQVEEDQVKVECLFNPPLHQERHMLVMDLLVEAGATSVIDLGCNSCKLLRLLKGLLPNVTYLAGLDMDKYILEDSSKMLRPLPGDWLMRRTLPLTIELLHGSCGEAEAAQAFKTVRNLHVDAVTSVELIEHLDPGTIATFPATVLGVIQPKVWIVTTPNSDFNELFPNFTGPFRHWDHRFEWSRKEFKVWANQVAEDFPEYSVTFHGAGFWEATRESHGPASQVVVFTKKELAARRRGDVHPQPVQASFTESGWEVVEKIEYPVAREETRSREEQLGDELCFHLRGILWDAAASAVEEEEVGAPLSSLLQFESVAGMKTNVDEVTDVLQARGFKVLDGIVSAQENDDMARGKCYWWSDTADDEEEAICPNNGGNIQEE